MKELTLLSKGIKLSKICKTDKEAYIFERDMPAKYGLLFSNKPYIIQTKNLDTGTEFSRLSLI